MFKYSFSQDTAVRIGDNIVYLDDVVVGKGLDVASFIKRAKEDNGFYKAFRNLRILRFKAINDIRLYDKKEKVQASLYSKSINEVEGGCRQTRVLEEKAGGDFYNSKGEYSYYTASLYASLFFAKQKICGESNIVGSRAFDVRGETGMEKHKEMLKMLFFQPGKSIPGLPGIGNKLGVFESPQIRNYKMKVSWEVYNGEDCFRLTIRPRPDLPFWLRSKIVLTEMDTWFAASDMTILGRNWKLAYDAGIYDFDVAMEVQLKRFGNLTVPIVMRYNGDWDVAFKRREKGVFTATLSDFAY